MKLLSTLLFLFIVKFGIGFVPVDAVHTVAQVTTNSYNDDVPLINSNGHVVWCEHDGSDFEIFATIG